MQHHQIVNTLSSGLFTDYLEIGVEAGITFNQVDIARKVAVDPDFRVPIAQLDGEAHPVTSDVFFARSSAQFDCILVDGLHIYEQVRRDFMNSWGRIKPNGVVLIDDCIPSDDLAALRSHDDCVRAKIARGDADRNWMGDVYKLVVWINDFTDFSYCHVQGSLGVIAVWNRRYAREPWIGDEQIISDLSFDAFRNLPLPSATVDNIKRRVEGFSAPSAPEAGPLPRLRQVIERLR